MSGVLEVLVPVAIVGSGVVAGLLLIFSNAVMPALAEQDPDVGAATMVAINRIILNRLFLLLFMGTDACAAAVLLLSFGEEGARKALLLGGSALYLGGVFGVTAAVNVPLNERLEASPPGTPETRSLWRHYLSRWTRWNSVRTALGILATFLPALA